MGTSLKKRGQRLARRFSRASIKAGEEGKEHLKENLVERISHIQNIRLLILEWVLLAAALIMLALSQAFWSGESYAEDVFVDGGSYVEATLGKVNSLNPLFATTPSEKVLDRLLFSTIAAVDYSGHPGIGLASAITASEDGKVWTVRLREGLKWSDGEDLTNEDVLFTAALIQNPAVNSIYTPNLEGVTVAENEAGEIVFTLPTAYADFISALEIPVVPKHILEDVPVKTLIEADFSVNPVGSGAFSFNAVQVATGEDEKVFYLVANPYYYGGRPMLASFAVHTYEDTAEIVGAVNAGVVSATAALSGSEADEVISGSFNRKDSSLSAGAFVFFNTTSGVFSNRDLRAAVRKGLDLESIRAVAPGTTALDYPILASQIMLSNYPALPEYDPEASASEIAGLTGVDGVEVNIATVDSGYLPAVAAELATELEGLGISASVISYAETQDFISGVIARRNYDILVYEIELGADPDLLPYYHSSQASTAGLNLANYRNTLVDDLLVGARETLDATLRARKYESFLEYWVRDVPAIGLYQPNLTYIYNKNVRPYSDDVRLVTALDRFSDVTSWAANRGSKNMTP